MIEPGFQKAGAGRRLVANIVDGFIVGIPVYLLRRVVDAGLLGAVLAVTVSFGYHVVLEVERGATLGKSLLGVRIVGHGGGNPTPGQATVRNAYTLLGLVPYVGGLLSAAAALTIGVTIATDERGRGWHDRLAGAQPVRT